MTEVNQVQPVRTAGFVNPQSNRANRRRIEEDEAELNKLMNGEEDDTEEQVAKEATNDQEVSSEEQPEEQLSAEESTYKKRYSDLRKHLNEQSAQLKELKAKLESGGSAEPIRPPKSDEDIEAWATKYPDFAAIVETIADKKANEKFSRAEARLAQLDEISEKAETQSVLNKIKAAHPDFDDLQASDDFHDWANEQSTLVQTAIYDNKNDHRSLIDALSMYKAYAGLDKKSRSKAELSAASAVVNRRSSKPSNDEKPTTFSESQVRKMSFAEYEKNEKAIMKAMSDGSFNYDESGGAR